MLPSATRRYTSYPHPTIASPTNQAQEKRDITDFALSLEARAVEVGSPPPLSLRFVLGLI